MMLHIATQSTKDAFATCAIADALLSLSEFAKSDKSRAALIAALDAVSVRPVDVPSVPRLRLVVFANDYHPACGAQEAVEQCGLKGVTNLPLIAREAVAIAEDRLADLPAVRLDRDLAIAVAAYTYDLGFASRDRTGAGSDNFYCCLNAALRQCAQDANGTLPQLKPYLYYLFRGLEALPATNRTVYRGVPSSGTAGVCEKYLTGADVYWTSFSSATGDIRTAIKFAKRGPRRCGLPHQVPHGPPRGVVQFDARRRGSHLLP